MSRFNKEITLSQAIGYTITMLIVIIGGWVTMNVKIAEIETTQSYIKSQLLRQEAEVKEYKGKTDAKLDKIISVLGDIRVAIESKADRE